MNLKKYNKSDLFCKGSFILQTILLINLVLSGFLFYFKGYDAYLMLSISLFFVMSILIVNIMNFDILKNIRKE